MKLVGRYDSPFVRRVGVSLHALGMPYEHLPLSPFSQAAELRKLAPVGRMPVIVLETGETLIESGAILDYLDEIAGPDRALVPRAGVARRKALRTLAAATAACDKAIAITYERRRPSDKVSTDWIVRCRVQLDAALSELESSGLELSGSRRLTQVDITTACMCGYVQRVEPDALSAARYPSLSQLSTTCEARSEFAACRQ
jgi:glutathione S-transferase